tara:strand:- start:15473 stop:15826 length:354 start_codon:yes stop_codon:yes gene_type:complete
VPKTTPTSPDYWPCTFYDPEDKNNHKVCTSPKDVPEGWVDPQGREVDEDGELTLLVGEEDDDAGDRPEGLSAYSDITAKEIQGKLDELGVNYNASDSKRELYDLWKDALTSEPTQED